MRIRSLALPGVIMLLAAAGCAVPSGGHHPAPLTVGACYHWPSNLESFIYHGPPETLGNGEDFVGNGDCSGPSGGFFTVVFAADATGGLDHCQGLNPAYNTANNLAASGVMTSADTLISNQVWLCGF